MMAEFDLFFFFRRVLVIVCAVYGVVRFSHSLWRGHRYLSSGRRSTALARDYLLLHLLRVRVHRFSVDLLGIAILTAALIGVIWLHRHLGLIG